MFLIISCRFLCDECTWSGGFRDHMISERLLPLGHDRHGQTHWFLPSVGYFVESHDPRGWGYYSSLHEVRNRVDSHFHLVGMVID